MIDKLNKFINFLWKESLKGNFRETLQKKKRFLKVHHLYYRCLITSNIRGTP